MIKVETFKGEHLYEIEEYVFRTSHVENSKQSAVNKLEKDAFSYTIRYKDKVVFCGGVHEFYPGRGEAWAITAENCEHLFTAIHRVVRRFLLACTVRRIEAVIDCSFEQGHRWVKMLGFKLETEVMKEFGTKGQDCSMYTMFSEVA